MSESPEDTLRAYVTAFETLDVDAFLPYYSVPVVFIAHLLPIVAESHIARMLASKLVADAKAADYRRTEILDLTTKTLTSTIAMLSGVFVRYNSSNGVIDRSGFTYTMHNDGTRWKIVVAILHDPPSA